MAEFQGKDGHWVTANGRHIFISDDPVEKQEREIKAQEEQTKRLTAEKQDEPEDDVEFSEEELDAVKKVIDKFYRKGEEIRPENIVEDVKDQLDLKGRKPPIKFVCASEVDTYWGNYEEDYTFDETNTKECSKEYYLFKVHNDGEGIFVVVTKEDFNDPEPPDYD